VRSFQIIFCLIVIGTACYLRFVGYGLGWYLAASVIFKRDAMPKKSYNNYDDDIYTYPSSYNGPSSYPDSSSYTDSGSFIDPWIPLGLLIGTGFLGGIVAIASLITHCCGNTAKAMKVFMVFDAILVILWAAGVGTAGTFLSQSHLWSADYGSDSYITIVWKIAFALSIVLLAMFLYTSIHGFFLSRRGGAAPSGPLLIYNPALPLPPPPQYKQETHYAEQYVAPQPQDHGAPPPPQDQYAQSQQQPPYQPTIWSAPQDPTPNRIKPQYPRHLLSSIFLHNPTANRHLRTKSATNVLACYGVNL